ncbi:Endogenous Retrovirus Group K Member 6 Gag Polyprotein [Manis pentadactyla]|nr:Endogenous Retrovirus Group K Member 6 Gag Polyprotein [Manis pentadactyla]
MGNAPSLVSALQAVLKERNLKVSTKVLGSFVKEVDRVAPWFICSGSLSIPSWDKLGKDLDREEEEGQLRGGTRPLWKLIRACLQDEKCEKVIKAGQRALSDIQESMSETERETELARGRKRTAKTKVKKPQSEGESPSRAKVTEPREAGDDRLGENSKYPWRELRELEISNKDSGDELIYSEEEEETGAAKCGSKGTSKADGQTKEKVKPRRSSSPSAPPPYASGAHSFCAPEDLRAIRQMFPVIEDNAGVRAHQPLTHKEVKDLAEAVRAYGVSANYTLAQIERLAESAMTPSDWHEPLRPPPKASALVFTTLGGLVQLALQAARSVTSQVEPLRPPLYQENKFQRAPDRDSGSQQESRQTLGTKTANQLLPG